MRRVVFSILVDNTSGVLSRIAGLFSRRGYNIDSLTVGVTADPRFSRATVVAKGDRIILEQIEKQLNKLVDVVDIKRPKDSPIFLNIGGRRWFDGRMGTSNKQVAVKIGETYYKA